MAPTLPASSGSRTSTRPRPSIAEALPSFLARVRQMPEPAWFIKDLIPDEGVVVWHGRPRIHEVVDGRVRDVCRSPSARRCALGNPRFAIPGPVGVLWLGEEDSERLDAFRFNLMLEGQGAEAPDAFRLMVRPGWDLESPAGQAELLTTIRDTAAAMTTPLRVLVIDPVRASMPSIDGGPKDAARARAFLLTILRETSITVILLPHHDLKPRADGKDDRSRAERASGGVTFSMGDCMVNFERLDDRGPASPSRPPTSSAPTPSPSASASSPRRRPVRASAASCAPSPRRPTKSRTPAPGSSPS